MEWVSEAVGAIAEQVAVLSKAADKVSHRELIGLLAELTTVLRSIPALEHHVVNRLVEETEPCRLGEATWKKVLTTALRVSGAEAARRLARAKTLGPRRSMAGEPLPPAWEATAAAQAEGLLDEEHVAVIAKFHKKLPSWVDVDTRAAADRQLAHNGSGLDPENLAAAAARLLTMIDQDGPEPSDQEWARKRGITISKQRFDGTATISGTLTPRRWRSVRRSWPKNPPPEPTPYPNRRRTAAIPEPRLSAITMLSFRSGDGVWNRRTLLSQRFTGDDHRVHDFAGARERRRRRGHRRRITAADARSDPDGRPGSSLPVSLRPTHRPKPLPGPQ